MEIWKLLLFIPACFALNMTPGPNNLLSTNNARCYGFKSALIAGLGRISAFTVMIVFAASGLAVVLYTSETLFFVIKLLGAAYLLWIAFHLWRSEASPMTEIENHRNHLGLAKQEFVLAAGNPKAQAEIAKVSHIAWTASPNHVKAHDFYKNLGADVERMVGQRPYFRWAALA
ncbi:LysE family translocator [Photobacterium sp. 1_MG-2023]|uniref:LysE family translocator n=1 Tax=Photobacterium sp. 1_MG-2023 TaxID=3062646 RepID=UPI0026E45AFE|nr:LysE family translocator [Photobacterium sp. 1_MG-2023]MDO6706946.1 LysE family translocator [Photobacterium sp. 1_MG-2023]